MMSSDPAANLGFDLLYDQGGCLVVGKPAGILTQAPPGIDSLAVRLRAYLAAQSGTEELPYLAVPHRLDRPASGVMIFATQRSAARKISRQFERRQIKKLYWALVQGEVSPAEGTWFDYLRKIPGEPRAQIVSPDNPEAQDATLHYRTLGKHTHGTWLEIRLETGRTHQIRVQAASRGHTLLGDAYYGSQISFGQSFEDERLRAIALHARTIGFLHPSNRQPLEVTAPVADAWHPWTT
jgi:RluA family pseudouridine synthase